MIIKGYACHFNRRNSNGEIVTPSSFDVSLKYYSDNNLAVPINYNHISDMILGKVLRFVKDSSGLFIEADINDEVDSVKNFVKPLVKDGTLNRFSTEGVIKREDIEQVSKDTYIAKNFELRAIAIVPMPADIDAVFSTNSKKGLHYFNAFDNSLINKGLLII